MILKAQTIKMDTDKHEVYVDNEEVFLTTKEFELLELLLAKKGEVLKRGEVLSIWEDKRELALGTNMVDVYISYLRKKIGPESIETIRNFGYKIRVK